MTPYEILAYSSRLTKQENPIPGPAMGLSLSMLISEKPIARSSRLSVLLDASKPIAQPEHSKRYPNHPSPINFRLFPSIDGVFLFKPRRQHAM